MSADNVKVVVRVRPMNSREKSIKAEQVAKPCPSDGSMQLRKPGTKYGDSSTKNFAFDFTYDENVLQRTVYDEVAFPLVESVLQGYNGTIFAYGQTGCGKTWTMEGPRGGPPELNGIIPNSFVHIFDSINTDREKQYLVQAGYLEIYNEEIRDLLGDDPKKQLPLKQHPDKGCFIPGLTRIICKRSEDIQALMDKGNKNRSVASTKMNAGSSRSHSIFMMNIESSEAASDPNDEAKIRAGKLNLVDLAGSERQSKTGAEGARLKEATKINLSLSALGNVISALVDGKGKGKHIPYRDSKLTRLLQDSLGGNTKTIMFCCASPAGDSYDETLSTLRYANRAKNIKNKAKVNEDPKDAMIREFQSEIVRLRQMLLEMGADETTLKSAGIKIDERAVASDAKAKAKTAALQAKMSKRTAGGAADQTQSTRPTPQQADNNAAGIPPRAPQPPQHQPKQRPPVQSNRERTSSVEVEEVRQAPGGEAGIDSGPQSIAEQVQTITDHDAQHPISLQQQNELKFLQEKLNQQNELTEDERKVKDKIQHELEQAEEAKKQLAGQLASLQQAMQNQKSDEAAVVESEKRLIEQKAKKYKDRQRRLAKQKEQLEEQALLAQENFKSVREEVTVKTKKIHALKQKYLEATSEIADLQAEFETERQRLNDDIRDTSKELALYKQIAELVLGAEQLDRVTRDSRWDATQDRWELAHIDAQAAKRALSQQPQRPRSESPLASARRAGPAGKYGQLDAQSVRQEAKFEQMRIDRLTKNQRFRGQSARTRSPADAHQERGATPSRLEGLGSLGGGLRLGPALRVITSDNGQSQFSFLFDNSLGEPGSAPMPQSSPALDRPRTKPEFGDISPSVSPLAVPSFMSQPRPKIEMPDSAARAIDAIQAAPPMHNVALDKWDQAPQSPTNAAQVPDVPVKQSFSPAGISPQSVHSVGSSADSSADVLRKMNLHENRATWQNQPKLSPHHPSDPRSRSRSPRHRGITPSPTNIPDMPARANFAPGSQRLGSPASSPVIPDMPSRPNFNASSGLGSSSSGSSRNNSPLAANQHIPNMPARPRFEAKAPMLSYNVDDSPDTAQRPAFKPNQPNNSSSSHSIIPDVPSRPQFSKPNRSPTSSSSSSHSRSPLSPNIPDVPHRAHFDAPRNFSANPLSPNSNPNPTTSSGGSSSSNTALDIMHKTSLGPKRRFQPAAPIANSLASPPKSRSGIDFDALPRKKSFQPAGALGDAGFGGGGLNNSRSPLPPGMDHKIDKPRFQPGR